jgi:hypothetical protein
LFRTDIGGWETASCQLLRGGTDWFQA